MPTPEGRPTGSRGPDRKRPADPARSGNPAVRSAAAQAGPGTAQQRTGTSANRSGGGGRRPGRRPRQRLILGVLLGAVVVILVAAIGIFSYQKSHRDPQAPAPQPSFGPVTVTNGKPIRLGKDGAPVTLTLFEDFNCPHCADFEQKFGPTITDLQRSGRVRVDLYPMSFVSKRSPALANAMACAATEGFGQAYYAGLFANYGLAWNDDQLIRLGSVVGKPSADFAGCVRSSRHGSWVDSITRAAQQQKVERTPTVFINGVRQSDKTVEKWSVADLRSRIGAAK